MLVKRKRMILTSSFIGGLFALTAAIFNGTVGILSRIGFDDVVDHSSIAFWRCLVAFLVISLCIALKKDRKNIILQYKGHWWKLALCSFLGVFMLYHFETMAFAITPIPVVSMLVFSGGAITVLLGILVLKERISLLRILSISAVFYGSFIIISNDGINSASPIGIVYSILAGLGYSLFIFSWKILKLESSIGSLWWFFLFGSFFLLIPYIILNPVLPSIESMPAIILLGIIPSFGGFYFTTLALKYIESYKTQIIETSEPLFTSLFAFLIFGELLSAYGMLGALIIFIGIIALVSESSPLFNRFNKLINWVSDYSQHNKLIAKNIKK